MQCAEQVGAPWIEINKCLYSKTGEEMMLAMEAKTHGRDPGVRLLPWIEYDGVSYHSSYHL
jgi:hypothetical protein